MSPLLASVRHHQGLLLGRVDSLGFVTSQDMTVESLTASVVSSRRIEGEVLDIDQVRFPWPDNSASELRGSETET